MDQTIKHGQLIEVSFQIQMPNLTNIANRNKSYNSSIPGKNGAKYGRTLLPVAQTSTKTAGKKDLSRF